MDGSFILAVNFVVRGQPFIVDAKVLSDAANTICSREYFHALEEFSRFMYVSNHHDCPDTSMP